MGQLLFRINGVTRRRSRRFRKVAQQSIPIAKIATWFISVGIGTYVVGIVLPYMAAIIASSHMDSNIAVIKGVPVIGTHVVLIRDTSGSMAGTEEELQKQIVKLKALGMMIEQLYAQGFGVSRAGSRKNLLHQIEKALKASPHLDVIYAFSDFEEVRSQAWRSDPDGYSDLEMLLTQRGVRLYLGTVRYSPSPYLLEIVRKSGGGIIQ